MASNIPVQLSPQEVQLISSLGQAYAITNGLVLRAKKEQAQNISEDALVVFHAPFTMYPSKLPETIYKRVVEIAPLLNDLVDKMSRDPEFFTSELKACAAADAEFTGKLLSLYNEHVQRQPLQLGLHRSDYMMHQEGETTVAQQVELNTISSAIAGLSAKTSQLHQFLMKRVPALSKHFASLPGYHQPAQTYINCARAIAAAHNAFAEQQKADPANCAVLYIVQPGERNVADQKHIEHALMENHNVPCYRMTLGEIHEQCSLDSSHHIVLNETKTIFSVAYFRAAYTPNDFPTENEWKARLMIENSTAIKCPSLAYHLLGTKKIQQVMARPGVLEKYITKEEAEVVRSCFTGIYALDDNEEDNKRIQEAIEHPEKYVLKPQREGGGNLIYGEEMQKALRTITESDRQKYILMERISPKGFDSHLIREGVVASGKFISELGIFGLYLGDGKKTLLNEYGGYILRTKLEHVEDGGVAAGVACLDSLFLLK